MRLSLIMMLLVAASSVSAEDLAIQVCSLQAHANMNSAYLRPCDTWTSRNGCSSGSYVAWNMSEFQGASMYSTSLAALVSGLTVVIRLDGQSCLGSYDEITMVRIVKQ